MNDHTPSAPPPELDPRLAPSPGPGPARSSDFGPDGEPVEGDERLSPGASMSPPLIHPGGIAPLNPPEKPWRP